MTTRPHPLKTKIGIAAGGLAAGTGLVLATGVGPAPSLLASASPGGSGDTTSTTDTTVAATVPGEPLPGPTAASRAVPAGPAGSLEVAQTGGSLTLVGTAPAAGWAVEVEQPAGREVEVDFRRGRERVQVNVEIEDGAVRERVRYRDDATGARSETVNGVAAATGGADDRRGGDDHDDHHRHDDGRHGGGHGDDHRGR